MLVDEERLRIVVEVAVDFHSVGALHIGRHCDYRVALSIPVRGILRYLLCLLQFRRRGTTIYTTNEKKNSKMSQPSKYRKTENGRYSHASQNEQKLEKPNLNYNPVPCFSARI